MAIPVPIREFLHDRHIDFREVTHPTAYTAQEEAAVAHVPGREWAKTVVCFADHEPILVVLPAHYSVDLDRLRAATGAARVRLATEAEIVDLYPGCEAGAMPPLGGLWGLPVIADACLERQPTITVNGGTHTDVIELSWEDFVQAEHPRIITH